MSTISEFRPSPIAGTWYSSDPEKLSLEIDHYLNQAQLPPMEGEVIGVIAPHAGHRYSGNTAGYAFRALTGKQTDLAIVISPIHTYESHPLLTTAHQAYLTPLGSISVDQEALEALEKELNNFNLPIKRISNDQEHSLEIELPFLQRTLPAGFRLLPIMISGKHPAVCQALGQALAKILAKRRSVLVASTDLSHFYTEKEAEVLDQQMLEQIAKFSPEGVLQADRVGTGLACGAAAVAAVLWAANGLGATHVQVLHHSTSGDITGDTDSVVGYGAAAILKHS